MGKVGSTLNPLIVEKKTEEDRFNWRPSLYAAIGAFLIFLPISLYSSQWGGFLYVFALAPAISLGLFVLGIVLAARSKPRQALAVVAALLTFWAVSWFLLRNELPIRSEVRWLFRSRTYKAQVLSQPLPANGELRSIEWDGWGLPGAGDTVVYLVFAPDDSLEQSPKNHAPGKFTGLPCEVDEIHRLEKDWYTVLFYTDTDWGHCR